MSRVRRLGAATFAATLLLVGTPAVAQQGNQVVSVSRTGDLDTGEAGQKITIKGWHFDPAANDGKGYGVRIGPQRTGWRDKATTTYTLYSKLLKPNWPFGIDLKPDGTWQADATVKANYTAGGEPISATREQLYLMIFPWDTADTSTDIVIPLQFKEINAKPIEAALNWGIKASWRAYIGREGTITPSQGAFLDPAGPYIWPVKEAKYDPTSGQGELRFGGKVNFSYEWHTIWDYGFASPKITIRPDGTGIMSATVTSAFFGTKAKPEKVFGPKEIAYADLVFDGKPTQSGALATLKIKSAKLTADGAASFGGFNSAGAELDAGTVTFTGTVAPPTTCEVGTEFDKGNLLWGFKRSFRQYVGGGKGNSITASGGAVITDVDTVVNQNGILTGAHQYPFTSAKYTSDTAFEAAFAGTITFDYPAHLFTMTLGNPRIVVSGKAGSLFADVELKAKEGAPGNPAKLPGVELAKLNLAAAQVSRVDGVLKISDVAATLASAEAFAGFYGAGEKLDNLTVTLGANCSALPASHTPPPAAAGGVRDDLVPPLNFRPQLANTGVELTALPVGLLLVAAGAVTVYFGRNRARVK